MAAFLYGEEGIRTGGRKAELVERIQSNATFQADIAAASAVQIGDPKIAASSAKKQKGARQEETVAIDAVFESFRGMWPRVSVRRRAQMLTDLAMELLDADPDSAEAAITDDGILALCDALGIDAQDPVMLALSCAMEAQSMCVYTRAEFRRGLEKLHCRSLADLRRQLPFLRRQLRDRTQFSSIYSFTFGFAKDPTQKSLALELAIGLWELLLPGHFHWQHQWLRFVRTHARNAASKDLWLQVLEFGHQIQPDLSNFDENGAWPVLLDDFAAHMLGRIGKEGLEALQQEEEAMAAEAGKAEVGKAEGEGMLVDE
ncbi:hypothetical protein BBJ28_00022593 [Nothophytophthora sp. Chile5]|nr:hypothetical protein BBJ28_00022593 [Nothophytophthora sp. Chile5]